MILTGASHTGKTTVAEAILAAVPPPAAILSVDKALSDILVRPLDDLWAEIPLAYDLLVPQLGILLDRGWFVVFESTFTFVPSEGTPEFHADALNQAVATAKSREAPFLLIQLTADDEVVRARARRTKRLPPDIVRHTAQLHRSVTLPTPSLALNATEPPDEIAQKALAGFAEISAA
jgi:predicted kinase